MDRSLLINQFNLISIAHVGDAVYSLFVRERLIRKFDCKSGKLHLLSKEYVKASSQSKSLESIMDKLTVEEADIVRRGRNAHTPSKAKNAGLADYKKATALEGLIGYLFLDGQSERLAEIMNLCAINVEKEER